MGRQKPYANVSPQSPAPTNQATRRSRTLAIHHIAHIPCKRWVLLLREPREAACQNRAADHEHALRISLSVRRDNEEITRNASYSAYTDVLYQTLRCARGILGPLTRFCRASPRRSHPRTLRPGCCRGGTMMTLPCRR
jgi:hypothetical protein